MNNIDPFVKCIHCKNPAVHFIQFAQGWEILSSITETPIRRLNFVAWCELHYARMIGCYKNYKKLDKLEWHKLDLVHSVLNL